MTLPEWMISRPMSRKLMERVLDNPHFMFLPQAWSKKLSAAGLEDKVVFKKQKSVFDRVIDLQTFYTIVTGNRPAEIHIGHREFGDIMKESRDIPIYSGHHKGMLGTLIGMPVFQKNKSHHMEIK